MWVLALMAWVVSCFFLRGDLGKYLDDCTLTLVDVATGRWTLGSGAHPWQDYGFFWRPLHLVLLYGLNTVFWGNDAEIHFVGAACHGWCAWMLFRFLRASREGCSPHAAGGAAVLFMVCPLNFQVALWPSTMSSAIGAGMLLWAARRVVMGRWEGASAAATIGATAFVAACFYEQPAAAFCALPLLALGSRGVATKRMVLSAAGIGAAVVAGLGTYWVLLRLTAPPFARGSGGLDGLGGALPARVGETLAAAWRTGSGARTQDLLRGSFVNGWEALSNPMGIALLATLALAALVWAVDAAVWGWRGRRADECAGAGSARGTALWAVAAFGAGAAVCSLLPIAVVESQRVQHRLLYVPLLGVVIVAWSAVSGAAGAWRVGARAGPARGGAAVVMALAVGSAVVVSSVCMVGFQALYQQRWRLDQRQLKQLAHAAGDAPEGMVLVPLRLRERAAGTGVETFDGFLRSVFETGWTARARARATFGRGDVWATHLPRSSRVPLREFVETGARYRPIPTIYERLLAEREGWSVREGVEIEYARMLPFTTLRGGDVELVRTLRVVEDDGRVREITFPLVERAVRERGARHGDFRIGGGEGAGG